MQSNAEPPANRSRPEDNGPTEPEEDRADQPGHRDEDGRQAENPEAQGDEPAGPARSPDAEDGPLADDPPDTAPDLDEHISPPHAAPAEAAESADVAEPAEAAEPADAPAALAVEEPVPPPLRDPAGNLVLKTSTAVSLIVVAAVVAAGVLIHLGMVFLHVAPSNTLSRQHDSAVDGYIYPEFEQNWKLFAPNPLQHNIAVHARVEIRESSGTLDRGDWIDLTAFDAENIRGNPFPSHTAQNELRRAWDFFSGSHDSDNKPTGPRGELSQTYIKRIAVLRLAEHEGLDPREVHRIQIRSATTPVQPPPWSGEKVKDETSYRTLPWWTVTDTDVPEAAR